MSKRDRAINFTREECEKLVMIAYQYKHIIENKKSDGEIWKEKEAAWKAIETKFNSSSAACRPYKTLKVKFEGLKRLVRQKMDLIWKNQQKTGVRSSSAIQLDSTEVMIKDMLCLSTQGITNNFDNDASTLDNPNEIEPMSTEEEYLEVWVKHEDDQDCSRDSQPTTSTTTEHTVPATEATASEPMRLSGSGVGQPGSSERQPGSSESQPGSGDRQSGSGERQAESGGRQPGSDARHRAASEASRRFVEERREFLSLHRALMLEEYRNKIKLTEEKGKLLDLRRALLVEENERKRKLWDLEEECLRLKLKKLNE